MAEFELQGMESLLAKLDAAKQEVKYKSGRSALRKAANVVAKKAKQKAQTYDDPATAESIAKNVAVRFSSKLFKRTGHIGFRIGILGGARGIQKKGKGKGAPGGSTFYWRFLETGTEKLAARPFLLPALKDNQSEVISTFAKAFEKGLDAAVKKANKAAKK